MVSIVKPAPVVFKKYENPLSVSGKAYAFFNVGIYANASARILQRIAILPTFVMYQRSNPNTERPPQK